MNRRIRAVSPAGQVDEATLVKKVASSRFLSEAEVRTVVEQTIVAVVIPVAVVVVGDDQRVVAVAAAVTQAKTVAAAVTHAKTVVAAVVAAVAQAQAVVVVPNAEAGPLVPLAPDLTDPADAD